MLRRTSNKTQNDENTNHVLKNKSHKELHASENHLSSTENIKSVSATTTSAATRTVLGVVPDNALNSHHFSQQTQFQQPQSENYQQQQQTSQQLKTKIPVLVDDRADSKSSTEFDDLMETSNIDHNEQENYTHNHNHRDYQHNLHIHHDIDDEEEEEEEEEEEDEEEEEEEEEEEDVDVDVDDEEGVVGDESEEDLIYNEPLSPVLTDSIRQEIDRVYNKFSRDTLDPNDEDTYDVTMVAEYGNRIFNYLHSLEIKYKPNPRYIEEVQDDLLWEHRSTLMDWLVQLHSRFNLLPETLYLAVNIIDRFLSKKTISLSRFQLCGAVALFLAAKYEEINVPTVSQMVYMVGNQYPRESFLRAERFMVEVLGFEFGWPGPMSFLRRGSKADDYDNEIRTLAKYFLEITIMDARFVSSPPSWLAAGAQFLSRRMLGRGDWTEAHVYYTGYTTEQLIPLAEILEECCMSSETHHRTIFQKYSERRFKRSACYVQQYLHELYGAN